MSGSPNTLGGNYYILITGLLPLDDMAKDGKSLTDEFDINNGLHATDADGKLQEL